MKGPATYFITYMEHEVEEEDDVRASSLSGTLIIDDLCSVCQGFPYAEAEYDIDYSMIDLGVGYQLRPDSDFGLQFIGGLVFGEIEEEFTAVYTDSPAVNGTTDVATI